MNFRVKVIFHYVSCQFSYQPDVITDGCGLYTLGVAVCRSGAGLLKVFTTLYLIVYLVTRATMLYIMQSVSWKHFQM